MLKKYLSWLTVAACAAAMTATLTACDDDDPVTATPTVTLKEGTATASTLSFTITPADAQEVAYVVVKKDEAVPEAAAILQTGTKGQADAAKEYTVTGLDPETAYVIAAAALNGGVYSTVAKIEMSTNDKPAPKPDKPTVTVTPGEATESTLAFTIAPSEGVEMAGYLCVGKGEPVPATGDELFEGDAVLIEDWSAPVLVEGLESETAYVIAVAVATKDAASDVVTVEMTTAAPAGQQYDEVIEATNATIAVYFGNDNHPDKQTGQFALGIDNIPWEGGYATGAGTKHQFCFYSDLASDPDNAIPADGTYKFDTSSTGDSGDKWTIGDNNYTWWVKTDSQGKQAGSGGYFEAEMTLTRSGGNYEVVMTGKSDDGKTFKITYSGPVTFQNKTVTDQNLQAAYAEAVYYGVGEYNPTTDSWLIGLFDQKDNATKLLTIDFYSTVATDPMNPVIPTGTFTPNDGSATDAGTFTPGGSLFGIMDYGTYLQVAGSDPFYCTAGSFTIAKSGSNYTITCNFTTDKNIKVTASFTGPIAITSKYEPPFTEDLTVNADRVYSGYGIYYGGSDGSFDYYFRLTDTEMNTDSEGNPVPVSGNGNFVGFDLYSATEADPANIVIPNGTYTLATTNAAGTFDPDYTFCWHWKDGDMSTVTMESGTVTVNRTGTNYTVKLDGTTETGNKLVCNYTGPIPMQAPAGVAPAGLRGKMLYSQNAVIDTQARERMAREKSQHLRLPDRADGTLLRTALSR